MSSSAVAACTGRSIGATAGMPAQDWARLRLGAARQMLTVGQCAGSLDEEERPSSLSRHVSSDDRELRLSVRLSWAAGGDTAGVEAQNRRKRQLWRPAAAGPGHESSSRLAHKLERAWRPRRRRELGRRRRSGDWRGPIRPAGQSSPSVRVYQHRDDDSSESIRSIVVDVVVRLSFVIAVSFRALYLCLLQSS